MSGLFNIHYIPQQEIDLTKWDHCINHAPNGLIYGYSYYLNHMAKQWDALVLSKGLPSENDYEAVMPLTWNKKYSILYLYQPFLTAQLGVFGHNISAEMLEAFLQAIPAKFSYWDFYLNYHNAFEPKSFPLYQRKNFVLYLDKPYDELYSNYRPNTQRNIRKAEKLGCKPINDFAVQKVINLAVAQMKNYTTESSANVERFTKLYHHLYKQQQAITYGVLSAKNEIVASCIFIFSHNRAYYILVGNHTDSRNAGASHFLIDAFIKDHAGKRMLLDFEGSDMTNLAHFYQSFGAHEENYSAIKMNKLPFYLKWMKK
ncbi:MAG: GNAT family N-acetyltransferase [Chitinophagaceae bacterium]